MKRVGALAAGIIIGLASTVANVARADDPVPNPALVMDVFEENGLVLSGAEYWPYVGVAEINYPAEVLWGFYPQAGVAPPGETDPNPATATVAAVACATKAWAKLKEFVHSNPVDLLEVVRLGADRGFTPKFYLWTNDYSRAHNPYPFDLRTNRLWFWKRNPPVEGRTPGYWKWESSVDFDGNCAVPEGDQIQEYVAQKLRELRGN